MEEKPRSKRPYTKRSDDDKRRPQRRSYGHSATDENRSDAPTRAAGERSKTYGRRDDRKPYEKKPYERKSDDQKPYGRKPYDDRKPDYRKKYTPKPKAAAPAEENGPVRLNKFIANSGICSRREADTYIETGLVTVNGTIVTELGTRIDPVKDDVRFNGQRIKGEKKVYIVMNKPKDFVTTMADPHADRTVMDLISKTLCPERVFPVGRLDKATTGVLLFTNDGDLTEKLTHPKHEIRKIYHATLDKNLKKEDFDKILDGIELEDGPIAADALSYVEGDKAQVGLEIHSGRNRIVRRIFEHLGYKVKKLDRVYFAGLTKKNLRRGAWRVLDDKEVGLLKMGAFE